MIARKGVFALLLTMFFCFPVYLISRVGGAEPRRTGGNFPGEQSCATAECHGGSPNTGPGSVTISINGMPFEEYRYTPGETVPVQVTVMDPNQIRWGFQITARTPDGCTQAGNFSVGDDTLVRLQDDDSAVAPCTPQPIQFPTHVFPKAGAGGATFELNWTAPESADFGPVVFAAAGNAANGNGDNFGDLIYTTQGMITGPGAPAPSIGSGGVVMANLLPTVGSISANAIISIFGQNFAPEGTSRNVTGDDLVDNRVPTLLAGVCVEVNQTRAPIFFVSPLQLNVQAPSLDAQGPVPVEVISGCGTANEQRSPAEMAVMEPLSPTFFVKNFNDAEGRNPIASLHGGGPAEVGDPNVIPGATPAEPGEFISLFGTGFGPTDPAVPAGGIPLQEVPDGQARVTNDVSVTIGGIPLTPDDIFYVGVAPCCAGLDQAVVKVPENAPDGDLPVILTIGGVSTPEGPFITVRRP